jgi:hypothetical protein
MAVDVCSRAARAADVAIAKSWTMPIEIVTKRPIATRTSIKVKP